MREAAIIGRVGKGSIRGLEDQISKWIFSSQRGVSIDEIERLVRRKFAQPFERIELHRAIQRTASRIGARIYRGRVLPPLTESKRSPRLDTMHTELVKTGLKPQISANADGPDFEFDTEEEAKKAAEILMKAGYGIRANNRQGKTYRVSASWAKDLSEAAREDIVFVYGWMTPQNEWVPAEYLGHSNAVLDWYKANVATSPEAQHLFRRIKDARYGWKEKPTPEQWAAAGLPEEDYARVSLGMRERWKINWHYWAFEHGWLRSTGNGIQVAGANVPPQQLQALQQRYEQSLDPANPASPDQFYIDYGKESEQSVEIDYADFLLSVKSMSDIERIRRRKEAEQRRMGGAGAQFFQPESVGATVLELLHDQNL